MWGYARILSFWVNSVRKEGRGGRLEGVSPHLCPAWIMGQRQVSVLHRGLPAPHRRPAGGSDGQEGGGEGRQATSHRRPGAGGSDGQEGVGEGVKGGPNVGIQYSVKLPPIAAQQQADLTGRGGRQARSCDNIPGTFSRRKRAGIRHRKRGYILTAGQSDAGSAGIFSRRTNQTQEARVYSHDGPIRRRKRRYILTTDQSDGGSAGIFSRRTNHTQEARVYSHDGPRAGTLRTLHWCDG
eukprot:1178239-Prorocentrum_minimum.AAC.1